MKMTYHLALAAVLAAVLGASPADAQGNGKKSRGNDSDRDRYEHRDRDRDRDRDHDDRPRFERRGDLHESRASQQRRVPPGWCQGRGNPHNTAENCRYNSRYSRWERYDSRTGRYETYDAYNRNRTRNVSGGSGSYDQTHREFHYSHDQQCRSRAAQRPLDPRWQIQVRADCKATHDDFHRRWGVAHR